MTQTLATFKIDTQRWEAFKTKAAQHSNASAVLKMLIDAYLAGDIDLERPSNATMRALSDRISLLEDRLGKSKAA